MLQGITITCFAASYAVALGLETARLLRMPVRLLPIVVMIAAGLLAQTLHLWNLARDEIRGDIAPLSSWYDWCLLAAWMLAAAYLALALSRPETNFGIFLLPLVLALVGIAYLFRGSPAFSNAISYWRTVHGIALLLGTVAVLLSTAAGVMYLVQSYRLKHKLQQGRLRLPSLEWLQRLNRRSLLSSMVLLGAGLLSGIVLNLIRTSSIAWTDLGVVSSLVLFLWLLVAVVFEAIYRPARQGRKVVYLTLASFVFLMLALGFVLFGQHAAPEPPSPERVSIAVPTAATTTAPINRPITRPTFVPPTHRALDRLSGGRS